MLDEPEPVVEFGWGIDQFVLTDGLLYWAAYCRVSGIDAFPGQLGHLPTAGGKRLILAETDQWDCETFWSMAADVTGVYYYNNHQQQIEFRSIGDPLTVSVITSLPYAQRPAARMQVDEQHLFWVSVDQHIFRVPKTGGQIVTLANTGANPDDFAMGKVWLWDWYQKDSLLWYDDLGLFFVEKDCSPPSCTPGQITTSPGSNLSIWSNMIFWVEDGPPRRIRRHDCSIFGCSNYTEYTATTDKDWWIGRVSVGSCPSGGDCLYWREGHADYVGARLRRKPLYTGEPDDIAVNLSGNCYDTRTDNRWVYFYLNCTELVRLPFNATALVRDLQADVWEVTQGIQSLQNDVPLVAEKPTYVRLYGHLINGPTANSVDAYLYGYRNGAPLTGSPLTSAGSNQTLEIGDKQDRGSRDNGWLFQLPGSWIKEGSIELHAIMDPYGIIQDPNRSNNELSGIFTFSRQAPACTIFIPVHTHTPTPELGYPSFWKMIYRFTRLWPIPNTWVYSQSEELEEPEFCWKWALFIPIPWVCQGPYELNEDASWEDAFQDDGELLLDINTRAVFSDDPDECDDAGSAVHYIGMVHHEAETQCSQGGCVAGMAYTDEDTLQHASWFILPRPRIYPPNDWTYPYEGAVMAHELSHNHERGHVDCGGPDHIDGGYPYPTNHLDDYNDPTHYGLDVNTQTPIDPDVAKDYMSYCSPEWVSDYTYKSMLNHVAATELELSTSNAARTPDLANAAEVVILSGTVDPANQRGTLNYAWVYPTDVVSQKMLGKWQEIAAPNWLINGGEAPQTSYHLRLLDAGGTTLGDYAITPATAIPYLKNNVSLIDASGESLEADGEDDAFTFMHAFPSPSGYTARIDLIAGATVLASMQPGSLPPTVSILQPGAGDLITQSLTITWISSDPDPDDLLMFNIQYSHDGGASWISLVQNLPAAGEGVTQTLTLDSLNGLHGSNGANALVRVAASDGYHTALAVSAAFTVPDLPPQPYIVSPESTQVHPPDEFALLDGGATDPEQGAVDGEHLTWQVDGVTAANGTQALVYGLAPGSHPVTLTATDDHSQTVTATTTLNVSSLQISQVETAPTLDGSCDDPAYTGAILRLGTDFGSGQAWVHLARTQDSLWVCFHGMQRMSAAGANQAVLAVDVNNSRDRNVQTDDYAFMVGEDGRFSTMAGDGSYGFAQPGPGEVLAQVSADAERWNAELRIESTVLGGWDHFVGIYPLNYRLIPPNITQIGWPYAAKLDQPNTWAETVFGVLPEITALSPTTATLHSQAFTLTIDGDHFQEGSILLWEDAPLTTTYISSTRITAQVLPDQLNTAGYFPLKVQNSTGGQFTSSEVMFTVENPLPILTSVSPDYANVDSVGLNLDIEGNQFVEGAEVLWNGETLPTTYLNSNNLQVFLGAEYLHSGRVVELAVQNPPPGGGFSDRLPFHVLGRIGDTFLPLLSR